MILDDTLGNQDALEFQIELLIKKNYNIILRKSFNPDHALDLFRNFNQTNSSKSINMIISDFSMPIMNGDIFISKVII